MAAALGARVRMGRATAASLGLHLLAALAIPALAWTAGTGAPVETISFTHVLRIQLAPPRAVPARPRALAPHHSVTPRVTFANVRLPARAPRPKASAERAVATDAPAAATVATVQRAGEASATNGTAAPSATPSPQSRAVASVGSHQNGGYLPFGAEQPEPVLDPTVRKQLDAIGVHVTLVVTVADDGRTQNVVFTPPVDPQVEARIRSLLADANWDPAVCGGGVSCQGLATIKL